ncbi:Oxygen-independent coproporphyrinogen-III oxidase-like protein [Roseimaritima multifibrata]|uniref:Heme chaperone HemW n=1 Tax=Roseimaritima multifibrata TaxID=1930274 RepID=A0A517MGN7_9BACT|nr:radical SAM family heme chaperone HemW [Roseimaritima multifibrata]QDS94054.1 Oxygen-independent coproporphyrinogen-III oxidase-like protein [Roseimaritima multifibrata]
MPESDTPVDWPVPQAAYVHVPFCRHRCGYCNFSVIAGRDELSEAYLQALDWELQQRPIIEPVETLFLGGGTPTHLSVEWLERFLQIIAARIPLRPNAEFSIEANPRDIDQAKLELLQRFGLNRISLGVQSFQSAKLATLERDHDEDIASAAIRLAAQSIPQVSIDLIFAAPGETLDSWQRDLDTALALPITHLSTYALTFEKGTQFWNRREKNELTTHDELVELQMYQLARSKAAAAQMTQYEISSFAAAKSECRHNLHYWEGRGWYAYGPGAAGFVDGTRTTNHRSPTTYIRRCHSGVSPIQDEEPIGRVQWACERAAFGIRRIAGLNVNRLHRETGIDVMPLRKAELSPCFEWGLIEWSDDRLRLTEKGIPLADSVSSAFL